MIAFWSLVVLAIVALFRVGTGSHGPSPRPDDPMDVLDQRFARGEIDEDEYQARRAVLRATPH